MVFLRVHTLYLSADNLIHFRPCVWCHMTAIQLTLATVSHVTSPRRFLVYSACNPKDNYDMSACVFVVQFNGFMSLTS